MVMFDYSQRCAKLQGRKEGRKDGTKQRTKERRNEGRYLIAWLLNNGIQINWLMDLSGHPNINSSRRPRIPGPSPGREQIFGCAVFLGVLFEFTRLHERGA